MRTPIQFHSDSVREFEALNPALRIVDHVTRGTFLALDVDSSLLVVKISEGTRRAEREWRNLQFTRANWPRLCPRPISLVLTKNWGAIVSERLGSGTPNNDQVEQVLGALLESCRLDAKPMDLRATIARRVVGIGSMRIESKALSTAVDRLHKASNDLDNRPAHWCHGDVHSENILRDIRSHRTALCDWEEAGAYCVEWEIAKKLVVTGSQNFEDQLVKYADDDRVHLLSSMVLVNLHILEGFAYAASSEGKNVELWRERMDRLLEI